MDRFSALCVFTFIQQFSNVIIGKRENPVLISLSFLIPLNYFKANGDSVSVSSLVSKFELQLQEATFDLLERYESSTSSRKTSNIRRKRDGETTHRTAFVTRLHHHRERK